MAVGAAVAAVAVGTYLVADANAKTAEANEAAAKNQQTLATQAANSPQELAALEQQNQIATQNLARQQALVNSADPAMIEIGKQTLAMLRGEKTAGAVGVANKQRQQQRSALEARLRAQLGPGYANTSAGIQALNSFDSQTADLLTTTQQNAIQSNLPTLANISANGLQQSAGLFQNVSQGFANSSARKTNAILGTGSAVIQTSGSENARQAGMGNVISSTGSAYLGASGGGGGGGGGMSLASIFGGGGAQGGGGQPNANQGTGYLGGNYNY